MNNEITETRGRLHPLRPQNKQHHTPRITGYKHTRQDRRIQEELALTLTKNAIKPDPSEIIQLQTTRKKINWKTKETLAGTAVTPGDGTDQRVQSLMFMMMIMNIYI